MVGLLDEWLVRRKASTYTGQHNTERQGTNIHALSGIQTHDPSNRPTKTHASDRTAAVTGGAPIWGIFFDIVDIFSEEYKLWISSFCSFFHPPINSSLLGADILLKHPPPVICITYVRIQIPHPVTVYCLKVNPYRLWISRFVVVA
jgi:hypothetical protein